MMHKHDHLMGFRSAVYDLHRIETQKQCEPHERMLYKTVY